MRFMIAFKLNYCLKVHIFGKMCDNILFLLILQTLNAGNSGCDSLLCYAIDTHKNNLTNKILRHNGTENLTIFAKLADNVQNVGELTKKVIIIIMNFSFGSHYWVVTG